MLSKIELARIEKRMKKGARRIAQINKTDQSKLSLEQVNKLRDKARHELAIISRMEKLKAEG